MSDMGLSGVPRHGDTKIIMADGHDAGASLASRDNVEHGYTAARFRSWLTPSGGLVEEGKRYRVRWIERFRGARYDGTIDLLRYRGAWEIDSEALPPVPPLARTDHDTPESPPRGRSGVSTDG